MNYEIGDYVKISRYKDHYGQIIDDDHIQWFCCHREISKGKIPEIRPATLEEVVLARINGELGGDYGE
jgi:hypothetical protein